MADLKATAKLADGTSEKVKVTGVEVGRVYVEMHWRCKQCRAVNDYVGEAPPEVCAYCGYKHPFKSV